MTVTAKGTSIFQAEEVSAKVLGKLKEAANDKTGSQCVKCIVTVPAYFNDLQRRATKEACTLAGLQCVHILNEPTAAALSCGLHIHSQAEAAEKNILIFDFGGGTLDVSILRIEAGRFRVLATSGDCHLGGQDVDNALVEHFRNFYKEENDEELPATAKTKAKLKVHARTAKEQLTAAHTATVYDDSIAPEKEYSEELTRFKFEEICRPIFERIFPPLDEALKDAKLEKEAIDDVILVGGSTRIPQV